MKPTIVLALALVASGAALYPNEPILDRLIAEWTRLNPLCRGGHGDDPATMTACEQRLEIEHKLHEQGCGYQGKGGWVCGE